MVCEDDSGVRSMKVSLSLLFFRGSFSPSRVSLSILKRNNTLLACWLSQAKQNQHQSTEVDPVWDLPTNMSPVEFGLSHGRVHKVPVMERPLSVSMFDLLITAMITGYRCISRLVS
jgi:hypothetical protein